MNTTCLEQLVGLNQCESSFGYSLNQIGLSAVQLEDFIDDSYANVDDMVTDLRKHAARMLINDLLSSTPTSIKVNNLLETGVLGIQNDDKILTTGGNYRGIRIAARNNQEFANIVISEVSLFLNHSGTVDVLIVNLTDGTIIDTIAVTAVAGQIVKVPCQAVYHIPAQNVRLAIIYNAAGISSYRTTIYNSGCVSCGHGQFVSAYLSASQITATSPFTYNSTDVAQHTGGLSVQYSIECANELWLCTIRHLLGLPMLYALGKAIFEYGLNSGTQFSNQQTVNYERNEKRYELIQFNYQEQLKKVLNAVKFPTGRCFECAGNYAIINRLPG